VKTTSDASLHYVTFLQHINFFPQVQIFFSVYIFNISICVLPLVFKSIHDTLTTHSSISCITIWY